MPVAELAAELLELVGPYLDPELLRPLDATACEADRQLDAGSAEAACRDAVERSQS